MKTTLPNGRQLIVDEHSQEDFSDDSINLNCVLSWNLSLTGRLRLDLHGEVKFDSDNTDVPTEKVQAAIERVRNLYASGERR
jgi:hypothetical protein